MPEPEPRERGPPTFVRGNSKFNAAARSSRAVAQLQAKQMPREVSDIINDLIATGLTKEQTALVVEWQDVTLRNVTNATRNVTEALLRRREQDRLRQQRWRKNHQKSGISTNGPKANDVGSGGGNGGGSSHVTRNVTEAAQASLSEVVFKKEGNQEKTLTTTSIVEGQEKEKRTPRGTRLSPDVRFSDDDLRYAVNQGIAADEARRMWTAFVDYWIAVPGARGTKLDWHATWRTWVRRDIERRPRRNGLGNWKDAVI